jgi:hypothetical protein
VTAYSPQLGGFEGYRLTSLIFLLSVFGSPKSVV